MKTNPLYYIAVICIFSRSVSAASTFETYGDIGQFMIPAIAAGVALYQGDDEGLQQFSYSILSTTITVEALKYTVDAPRPNGGNRSFPSGHTAWAFSGASYLQARYGWHYGLPAYVAAGAVGWSRVDSNHHYWRDVLAGAAIATGFSYTLTSPMKGQQLAIYPVLMGDNAHGVEVNFIY